MDLKSIQSAIKQVRDNSKDRNFTQTFDVIVNLQNLDLKQPSNKIDLGVQLYCPTKPKKLKILAVIDHSITGAEEIFDKVIYNDELMAIKDNLKEIRKITHGYDKFVVLANYMPQFAQVLGKYLGPMNKMPSPKLGMIINPKTPLKELYDKLQKTAHLQIKKNLVLQTSIGSEKETDEIIAKNILFLYDSLIHVLPGQKNNIKDIGIKLTMGSLVRL